MLLRNVDVRRMEVARVNVSPRHRDVRGDGVGGCGRRPPVPPIEKSEATRRGGHYEKKETLTNTRRHT